MPTWSSRKSHGRSSSKRHSPGHGEKHLPPGGPAVVPAQGPSVTYIGLLRKESGSSFGVDFPDFPGCITAGDTLEEASRRAREALALHVQGMLEDGEALPGASTLDVVMANKFNRSAVAILVELARPRSRSVRVDITLQENLLTAIDQEAHRRGVNRSRFLAEVALRELSLR